MAVLELESPVPQGAGEAQAARAELWRLTLLQALAEQSALAARGGLKCDVSFNTRGMRLMVSGYSQRVPSLMALLLSRTLRHTAFALSASELGAARRMALMSAARQARPEARTLVGDPPQGRISELQSCSAEQMQAEISRLFKTVTRASLLLAGDWSPEAAEGLVSALNQELRPVLTTEVAGPSSTTSVASMQAAADPTTADVDEDEELMRWAGTLYKPSFTSALALNACYDPAIARALDQCGTI